MNTVKGSTGSETKLIKAIQKAVGANQDGLIGAQTMADIAVALNADCWPLTINLYSQPTIICRDIVACNPKAGCRNFSNSLSGSFSYQQKPCSILVSGGKTVYGAACHAWLGKPESVLYRLQGGGFGIRRCKASAELPQGVRWAVGGMGLLDLYDPAAEGFSGQYADVLRRTNHTVIGIKNGMVYLVYCQSMTAAQVNAHAKKLGLEYAVMLDGGHVAAINGAESFARINTNQVQYYLIQGV